MPWRGLVFSLQRNSPWKSFWSPTDFHIGNGRISGRQGIQSHSRGKKAEQREPALGHMGGRTRTRQRRHYSQLPSPSLQDPEDVSLPNHSEWSTLKFFPELFAFSFYQITNLRNKLYLFLHVSCV